MKVYLALRGGEVIRRRMVRMDEACYGLFRA